VRLRIDLAYDGTDYSGWAKQPDLPTIQGTLEDAIATVTRAPEVNTIVAGRTDAGVHATGQVVHVDIDFAENPAVLPGRLNSYLANTAIVIHSVIEAPAGFDARFSPLFRRYEYRISDESAPRDPRNSRYTYWVDDVLDFESMNAAANSVVGLHDWTTYCRPRPGSTSVRELQRFDWARDSDGSFVATIQGDAFCHNMVRNLVGMSVAVGRGRLAASDAVTLRDQRLRTAAFIVLPPHGLTLVEVGYPSSDEVGKRAVLTRDRRPSV
jgi:tRNA pseudouridine38-40 synthase